MKKYIQFIRILVISIGLTSCEKMLDKTPLARYSDEQFYQTESQILEGLTAAYAAASFTNVDNILWVFGDVVSDDATKGGIPSDKQYITQFETFEFYSDNEGLGQIWKTYNNGIGQSNIVISKLDQPKISDELRNRIEGEAQFLRAYYYFILTNIFRDIPLLTTVVAPEELDIPASAQSEIWKQIEEDCTDAITKLPISYGANDVGRATKGAAHALLAKTYLFQKKYNECLTQIEIIETLGYDLMPNYSHNFKMQYENNAESIWEIQHLGKREPQIGSALTQICLPRELGGWGFNLPTQDFVNTFEETNGTTDPRLYYTVAQNGEKWINGEDFKPEWTATGYIQKKYVQPTAELIKINDGDLNYTNIRYADVLLWKAEALNELGHTNEAAAPLNKVRKRARESYLNDTSLTGYGSIPTGLLEDISLDITQSQMREKIRHERRAELGFEMHRYFDLKRWGILQTTMKNYSRNYGTDKGKYFEEKHIYFPIPLNELQLSPNLKQNPDY